MPLWLEIALGVALGLGLAPVVRAIVRAGLKRGGTATARTTSALRRHGLRISVYGTLVLASAALAVAIGKERQLREREMRRQALDRSESGVSLDRYIQGFGGGGRP